jgi:cytidine deaminase
VNREELVAAARTAAENSYSPYSGFRVGAVVVADDGRIYTGANVENAAYPSSNCGEATAINTAVADGVRKIDTLVVACIDAADVQGAYPCGRCRQIMAEFGVDTVIVAGREGSEVREHTLDELLPNRFTL